MSVGATQQAVQAQVNAMGDLTAPEKSMAQVALVLAAAVDAAGADVRALPNLTKELRLALKQLTDGHAGGADDEWGDMGDPV